MSDREEYVPRKATNLLAKILRENEDLKSKISDLEKEVAAREKLIAELKRDLQSITDFADGY
jgi:cell division septum initiation protein DivIVA